MEIVTSSGQVNKHLAHFVAISQKLGAVPEPHTLTNKHTHTNRTRDQVKDRNWSQRQLKNVSFGFASVQFGLAAHSRVCFEFILFFLNEALPSHCQNIEIKEFSILISLARIVARQKGVRLRAKMEMETATGDGLEGGPTTASYGQRLLLGHPKRSVPRK